MKTVFRVDSRLVHGQTVNYWCKKYGITKIIVVNDELAKDDLKKLFFNIAISNEMELEFLTIKQSINIEYDNSINYMVIFENVDDVVNYAKSTGQISDLIVSNVRYGDERIEVSEGVFISKKDNEQLDFLQNKYGVNIIYKTIPD